MDELTSLLLLYSDKDNNSILSKFSLCFKLWKEKKTSKSDLIKMIYENIKSILVMSDKYGFSNNLWQDYIALYIISNENPFSLSMEMNKNIKKTSVTCFAKEDFKILHQLFNFDFSEIETDLGINCFSKITNSGISAGKKSLVHKLSFDLAKAKDDEAFFNTAADFYSTNGAGIFGVNSVFRISSDNELIPVVNNDPVKLDDLVGYTEQKETLKANTKAFLSGKPANNVLLYGDAGTGKSSSIKALANEYETLGLRLIEIHKYQFSVLTDLISKIKDRNYKFIIFIDDLSFEENETEYKYLKAAIEGGVEVKPDNVLIYATSNRRHLIKEIWADRKDMEYDDDLHRSDTIEEKLSLSARFGVRIYYSNLNFTEYQNTVIELAKRAGLNIPKDELLAKANKWELYHTGRCGRTIAQFITDLISKE